mgnify:CR=1 FL=1
MYAKILNNSVVKYPFTLVDLEQENPYTKYNMDVDLIDIYPKTETGTRENSFLVEVHSSTPPSFNPALEKIVESNPILSNEQWVQNWVIEQLSEEEKFQAKEEKSALRDELIKTLDELTYAKMTKLTAEMTEDAKKALTAAPLAIFVG